MRHPEHLNFVFKCLKCEAVWLRKSHALTNAFPHALHAKFFASSSVWQSVKCVFLFDAEENSFWHNSQIHSFSFFILYSASFASFTSVCILPLWLLSSASLLNLFSHREQAKGFDCECVIRWIWRPRLVDKKRCQVEV